MEPKSKISMRAAAAIWAVVLLVGACSGTSQQSTVPPTPGPATASAPVASGPVASTPSAPTPLASVVATVPPDQLVSPGKLLICSDVPSAPFEQYDAQGNLVGFDIDMGTEIAHRLGLQVSWVNSVFDTIIEALMSGKCDLIMSSMFITPARQKQIDFIPYFTAGEGLLVAKGNPLGLDPNHPLTLCGTTLTTQLGGAEADDAKAWSQQCVTAGKSPITILQSPNVTESLQQVDSGHAASFFYDSPVVAYYARQQPNLFEVTGGVLKPVLYGIGVNKGKPGLESGVVAALKSEQADGFFAGIMAKWGQQGTVVPPLP